MAIKSYKPTTPARRNMTVSAFEGIDKKAKPERSLTETLKIRESGGWGICCMAYIAMTGEEKAGEVCRFSSCLWSDTHG